MHASSDTITYILLSWPHFGPRRESERSIPMGVPFPLNVEEEAAWDDGKEVKAQRQQRRLPRPQLQRPLVPTVTPYIIINFNAAW